MTETLQMVNAAYGDQALSRSNVFRWYGRFRDGREDIEDDPRSGRPTECRNDNNVERISQLLLQNRHLSLRMLADEVNIGKGTVRKILVEDLRKRKVCSRFVPHSLTPEQKERRVVACRDLIATADSDPAVCYKGEMGRPLNRIRRVRPDMCESVDWFLLHDNAPSHNATIVKQFLAQRKVTVLENPRYSPDLAPDD